MMDYIALKRQIPALVHPVRWARWIQRQSRYGSTAWTIERVAKGRVLAGLFRGLQIPILQGDAYPELLGTYESALTSTLQEMIARKPWRIIDIGAAYGYYALGFAMRLPSTQVIAYEWDNTRCDLLEKYRNKNGLKNVEPRGECTATNLSEDLRSEEGSFVLVDIEGGEAQLLDPQIVPALSRVEILVELHEMFVPGVTELLQSRFARSHNQAILSQQAVSVESLNLPALGLSHCDPAVLNDIINEPDRGAMMQWLHLRPR